MATGTRAESIKKLRDLLKGIKIAMLTTAEEDATLRSRPMVAQQTDFDGYLWFITEMSAPKVREAQQHRQVNVSYMGSGKYVSISGAAELVGDRRKIDELWTADYETWFPNGKNDPNIGLLKVYVNEAEYWESPSNVAQKLIGFVQATASGERYEGEENKKLDL